MPSRLGQRHTGGRIGRSIRHASGTGVGSGVGSGVGDGVCAGVGSGVGRGVGCGVARGVARAVGSEVGSAGRGVGGGVAAGGRAVAVGSGASAPGGMVGAGSPGDPGTTPGVPGVAVVTGEVPPLPSGAVDSRGAAEPDAATTPASAAWTCRRPRGSRGTADRGTVDASTNAVMSVQTSPRPIPRTVWWLCRSIRRIGLLLQTAADGRPDHPTQQGAIRTTTLSGAGSQPHHAGVSAARLVVRRRPR
jgi:hypothetical protein